LNAARNAYRVGRRELADKLNKTSQEATLKAQELSTKAEKLAFEASNIGRINTHTVDLHHLYLEEAITRLKKHLSGLTSFVDVCERMYRIEIITGKGNNSVDNKPVLRPAVMEYLRSNNVECEIDETNEGVVLAYIYPSVTTK